ncbi:CPBP family intramembrane metalloprotease [Pseudomonas sp. 21LCFQ02]|uniref:CPBP family intramembrane glutamic endopeptidase n=1 Tax=Pseudomonas sp. 21LCFQ02 TaxID=2957505 RepID=UPI00209B324D|nr:CPBP family intramembrane glutamic endopeptidase [Pseudomonas sp. 21LCFQ02]MCO8170089.1 CPBP family intramembrane metalloprotease [Pseudomonas sp. 21LCFQ02]
MSTTRWVALALLGLGYGIALSHGALQAPALLAFGLLVLAAMAVRHTNPPWLRRLGHVLFIVTSLTLALHGLPGFNNAPIMEYGRSSPDAAPFISNLNLDKPLIGLWLLLACPWILHGQSRAYRQAAVVVIATISLTLALAWMAGLTTWAPKWPPYAMLWLLNNLLLVTLTEELLFRGYIQGALQHYCHRRRLQGILPVGITASLFGLAHIGGGWLWAVLAGLAGVGYGLAWRYGGLWAAVLAHFGLNLVHFCLFAYPMLEP